MRFAFQPMPPAAGWGDWEGEAEAEGRSLGPRIKLWPWADETKKPECKVVSDEV